MWRRLPLFGTALSLLVQPATAFSPPAVRETSRVSPLAVAETDAFLPKFSTALPMLPRPPMLKNELIGDVGFDPLNLADSPAKLRSLAESEVKHARLAMLAAAGWPASEVWAPTESLADGGRAPSTLNGHLLSAPGIVGLLLLVGLSAYIELGAGKAAAAESERAARAGEKDFVAGQIDPFLRPSFARKLGSDQRFFQLAELKNGRVAMVAVVLYVLEEAATGRPVTALTPWLFSGPLGGDAAARSLTLAAPAEANAPKALSGLASELATAATATSSTAGKFACPADMVCLLKSALEGPLLSAAQEASLVQ